MLAKAGAIGILGRAGEADPGPVRGGCSPQESAGPVTTALQMAEHYRWQTMREAGLTDEPRPVEAAVEDHLNDWLSR